MGKRVPSGSDQARYVVSGSFTGTGRSGDAVAGQGAVSPGPAVPGPALGLTAIPEFNGFFNASLQGTFTATVKLKRSFDGGTNYETVSKDSSGAEASFTAPVSLSIYEQEKGVLYAWECTAYTDGTVNYRISG